MDKTGTYRSPIYCKICKKEYLDPCSKHPNEWEIRNGSTRNNARANTKEKSKK